MNHFLALQLILTPIRGMVRELSICGQGTKCYYTFTP